MASHCQNFQIITKKVKPIDGQKTGTSGLRKKTKIFMGENYLSNWVQSLFDSLGDELKGQTLGLGGDGRYFNKEAAQLIIKIAAASGVGKVLVGKEAIMATPAMSTFIRRRKLYGGLIMSASHNPGGPEEDWGIKFNFNNGEPAPEKITDKIYGYTQKIKNIRYADIPDINLQELGEHVFGNFKVEVVDPIEDYLATLSEVFDFNLLKNFLSRSDFNFTFDALHAVTGAYAKPLFVDNLGADLNNLRNCIPKEDFGGGHPDPNLTYAHDLVDIMWSSKAPAFGAASDGDGDRNMILGKQFFITPSDSVAMIAANAVEAIPYFKKNGIKGMARSMPTSGALDHVAKNLNVPFFEVPTGWKFFANLMDNGKCNVCGEESFGTGSDHIREKDGLWAVLAWLSILAKKNENIPIGGKLVTVADIANEHWKQYGRNFFSRYDYENVDSEKAAKVMSQVGKFVSEATRNMSVGPFTLDYADDFEYTDPFDGSKAKNQGLRIVFTDGSRIIFRLSGTGSSGATIRMYIEQYVNDASKFGLDPQVALKPIIDLALQLSELKSHTGFDKPTVIT